MTDTTTYPLSVLVSAILGSEATSSVRLAADMTAALLHNDYLTVESQAGGAWDVIEERIRPIYGRVTDRELAEEALDVLRERNFLLNDAA